MGSLQITLEARKDGYLIEFGNGTNQTKILVRKRGFYKFLKSLIETNLAPYAEPHE